MHGITERGATRWVFIRIFAAKTAANARRFLRDLERACPLRIRTISTDNGTEFTDRLLVCAGGPRPASMSSTRSARPWRSSTA
jgi:IS30 family transposase